MRWVLLVGVAVLLAACETPRTQGMNAVRSITANCGAGYLAEGEPNFYEGLTVTQIEQRYSCLRQGIASNQGTITAGTANLDIIQMNLAYQEALYRQVAAGAVTPEDATLRFLDFKATLQEQVAQRRAALNAEQWSRLQMLSAINSAPRLQRGPQTISCYESGRYIDCTVR